MKTRVKIQLLRILRAAKVGEPTTLTAERARVYREALKNGLVVEVGERRSGVVCRLTKGGENELAVLEALMGGVSPNYAMRSAVRRATGDRDGTGPGELPEGLEE